MKFLGKNNPQKTIIIISDLHLGAGAIFNDKRNFLEDFHQDKELSEFLHFYSTQEYKSREVELIINGDFLDFLAVPYVPYFDDEFWSESAALDKLKIIVNAHKEVIESLGNFLEVSHKKLTYIFGNHDAEMEFPKLQDFFLNLFSKEAQKNISLLSGDTEYSPIKEVLIKHGHEYEFAHLYDPKEFVITSQSGERYCIPPWGSYYVTRIINKYKEERHHINMVKPFKNFIIQGLIYDGLFTLRFIFANIYYFFMVRIIYLIRHTKNLKDVINMIKKELELIVDDEELISETFENNPQTKIFIVGHTHEPTYKVYANGNIFINTGTWIKMINLDFSKKQDGLKMTYGQIDIHKNKNEKEKSDIRSNLFIWQGKSKKPYLEFS